MNLNLTVLQLQDSPWETIEKIPDKWWNRLSMHTEYTNLALKIELGH